MPRIGKFVQHAEGGGWRSELIGITPVEVDDLVVRGLEIVDVPPEGVGRALTFRSAYLTPAYADQAQNSGSGRSMGGRQIIHNQGRICIADGRLVCVAHLGDFGCPGGARQQGLVQHHI